MQRYFSNKMEDGCCLLSNDDSYHIKKVMRMGLNDQIEVVYNQKTYICEIISFDPVQAKVINETSENNEMNKKIIIVQSLVNENKMDIILQKNTELGAYSFFGYKASNSVVKENDKIDKKINRWQRIVKEASEQSKRNIIPKVEKIVSLKELCNMPFDLKILLSVNEKSNSVKRVLQDNKDCDTIMIVIGPEGGFTKLEEEELIKNGFISASLGSRVLRTETASIAFMSMINYEWMV